MSELIPIKQAANTWKGFLLRVAIVAVAAGVVLGIAALFGISFDPLDSHPRPVPQDTHSGPTPEGMR